MLYRDVANKYINMYNTPFSTAYQNAEGIIKWLINAVLTVTSADYYYINRAIKEAGLLAI